MTKTDIALLSLVKVQRIREHLSTDKKSR